MDTKLNWPDFPIFLAVIEEGNLSGAARALGLSQPTVGRRINALEAQMGAPLLSKTSSGLAPTEMGMQVLDHIRQMDIAAEAISRTTAAQEQSLAGDVTISATQGIGDFWLPKALIPIYQQHPEIRINIDVNFQMANLAKREADIALRWVGPGNQNSLIGRKVITTGFGLYASKNYLQQNGRPQNEAELTKHIGISVQIGQVSPVWPTNLDELTIPPARIALRSNSFMTHEVAIKAGYGIGSLAHIQADRLEDIERVLPDFSHQQDLWIVAHDDLSRNKRIRLIFDYLIEALQNDQDTFLTGTPSP